MASNYGKETKTSSTWDALQLLLPMLPHSFQEKASDNHLSRCSGVLELWSHVGVNRFGNLSHDDMKMPMAHYHGQPM